MQQFHNNNNADSPQHINVTMSMWTLLNCALAKGSTTIIQNMNAQEADIHMTEVREK